MTTLYLVRHGETSWSKSGQHTSYTDLDLTPHGVEQALSLREQLDPADFGLVLSSPRRRARRTAELAGFTNLEITDDLVEALKCPGKAVYVALHANHPREMTAEVRAACAKFVDAGLPMISQTVLLKGVNDDPAVLGALMRAFVETRIKPYYLHQGDLAPGTGHLRTSVEEGRAVMREMRGRFSGLCQPTYVLDIPDGHGKVPIGPDYLARGGEVEDPNGVSHPYPPRR